MGKPEGIAHWVCQDPVNTQRRDVAGSEADVICVCITLDFG